MKSLRNIANICVLFALLACENQADQTSSVKSTDTNDQTRAHHKKNLEGSFPLLSGRNQMAMNLGGEVYYSATNIYKDLMRSASPWRTSDANGTRWEDDIYFSQIPFRADGYPKKVPFYVNGSALPQHVESPIAAGGKQPAGNMHVLYKGSGEFHISGAQFLGEPEKGHRIYRFPEHESDHVLTIMRSDEADPIRQIAIVHKDDLDTYLKQPFNPKLFGSLDKPPVIRFMDLMFTNGNAVQSAKHATPLNYYTWNSCPEVCDANHFAGHPPEVLMQLSNRLNAHPWLTIGHQADDSFVRNFAERIKATISDDKYIFVEYSNELWNWLFPQAQWIAKQGCANPLTKVLQENGECDGIVSGRRMQAKRSLEIIAIFKEVFGKDADRIKGVLAGQGSWVYQAEQALLAVTDPNINPKLERFDILAIAPYFGGDSIDTPEERDFFVNSSFEALKQHSLKLINDNEVRGGVAAHKKLADQYGLALFAYEGGQHFVCGEANCEDQVFMNKLAAFQRHQVMEDLYDAYYKMWFEEGGSLFAVFSHMTGVESRWGAWGTSEYYGQPLSEVPKRRALIKASERYRFK